MLKPYSDLVKIDVLPYCDKRKAKDDTGKSIDVPYLNWAVCKQLLHENGAETVYFTPVKNASGGYLFSSKDVTDKNGRVTGCYFVSVDIFIDDKCFRMDMPLMNGSLVVYDDTLNQLRISNCHARAFVKGVAIHTGLGFNLWAKDTDTDPAADDLSTQDVRLYKERLEMLVTEKMKKNNLTQSELCAAVGIKEKEFRNMWISLDNAYALESELKKL